MHATIVMGKFMKCFYLPTLLVIGSKTRLQPETSTVFATGTLNVNPICKEKKLSFKYRASLNYKWKKYVQFHLF